MILIIGEILIDKFPEYERIGGAPFNFAFHLKQMGWPVRLITRIGDDAPGRRIQHLLEQHAFDLQDVQIDRHHPTGHVDVTLDSHGVPQFDIRRDVAYDHLDLSMLSSSDLGMAKMIYFGTLAQRTPGAFDQYRVCLSKKEADTIGFCDINFRPPHLNEAAIAASLHKADILKLNTEEIERIAALYDGPDKTESQLRWLSSSFSIPMIALTMGGDGSRIVTPHEEVTGTPHSGIEIVDTVGAGDGYAAVLAGGILDAWPLATALERATEFAAMICTLPGAIPQNSRPYQNLLRQRGKRV
jgi:fructokinase